ncbi:MAG: hypothetical protein KDA94_06745, partial [Acidimicrobiales bacterium]|nr:hypothetical protein [Acidimicrobiales bacterium]
MTAVPTAPGAYAPPTKPKLPGLAGIWIGSILIVVGIVGGIVLAVVGAVSVFNGIGDLQRVPIARGGTVTLEEAGAVSVYAERPSTQTGSGFNSGGYRYVPPVGIIVTGPDGLAVAVHTRSGSTTYYSDGREGTEIARFRAEEPGQYRIETVLRGEPAPYENLAVGNAIDTSGVVGIVGGVLGGGLVVIIGIVVLAVSLVRRGRARRRQTSPPWSSPPMPGGPPVGGPGWAPPPVAVPGGYGPGSWGPPPNP